MPKATVRANAQATPIDRRALFGSLAAAGALLAVPRTAKAAKGDPEVYAALANLNVLVERRRAADERHRALEARLPERPDFRDTNGKRMEPRGIWKLREFIDLMRCHGVDEQHAFLGAGFRHSADTCQAFEDWKAAHDAVRGAPRRRSSSGRRLFGRVCRRPRFARPAPQDHRRPGP